MFTIAIVEDDEKYVDELKAFLKRYADTFKTEFFIKSYSDGEQFITNFKSDYDIIFMDIQMPYLNGFDAAKKLREFDPAVTLVFITNLVQYAVKGYSVDASDFFVKPVNYFEFEAVLSKLLKRIEKNKNSLITLHTAFGSVRVDLNDIMFVEVSNHHIIYHLSDKNIDIWGSLTEHEKLLPKDSFVRCSSSFIINLKYVEAFELNTIKIGTNYIPISRSRKKEVIKQLNFYFAAGGDSI